MFCALLSNILLCYYSRILQVNTCIEKKCWDILVKFYECPSASIGFSLAALAAGTIPETTPIIRVKTIE